MSEPFSVGAYAAKTHLPQSPDRVERGETVVMARHGKPAAKLVPAEVKDVRQTVRDMLAYRDQHGPTLNGLSLRELLEEGRRH